MSTRSIAGMVVVAGSLAGGGVLLGWAGQPSTPDARPATRAAPQDRSSAADLGRRLVEGLEATQGCLGVNSAAWQDGRNSIVAWFEDKAAVERWYYSETHKAVLGQIGADADHEPLEHVEDAEAPVMVIATINFGGRPAVPGPIPFSEISIELYTPLPGGAYIGRTLAPEGFPVPHLRDYTPEASAPRAGMDDTDE